MEKNGEGKTVIIAEEGGIPEEVKEGMKDVKEAVMSNRDKFHSNIRGKAGNEDLDDEGVYARAIENYDKKKGIIEASRAENEDIISRLQADPTAAVFVSDIIAGNVPAGMLEYVMDNYNDFDAEDEQFKEFTERRGKIRDNVQRVDDFVNKYQENLEASQPAIEEYAAENKMSDEDIQDLFEKFASTLNPILEGTITKESLEMLTRMMNIDSEVATASEASYVKGKNEKIKEIRGKKIGDSLPISASANGSSSAATYNKEPEFRVRKSALEEGGYNRN